MNDREGAGADIGLRSSSNCPSEFRHTSRDLDIVVHGDDFIVVGCGDDLDWLFQKLNEELELVQSPSALAVTVKRRW